MQQQQQQNGRKFDFWICGNHVCVNYYNKTDIMDGDAQGARPTSSNKRVCMCFFFAVALWSFWLRRRQKWQHFFVVAFLVLTTLTVAFFAVFVGTVVVAAACAIITNVIHDQMPRSNKDLHGEVKIEILQHYLWIWLLHDCFQFYLFECWEILINGNITISNEDDTRSIENMTFQYILLFCFLDEPKTISF